MKNLIALFLLPLFAFSATADWEMVFMDEQATVIFPAAPDYSDGSGNKVWSAEIDSASRCMAMVLDFEKFGLSPEEIAEQFNNQKGFEEFKTSMLNKMEGAAVIAEKEITEGGVTRFEFLIHMGNEQGAINYMYNRNYFVGTKMYTLNFYLADQKEEAMAKRFFESFKIKEL